MKSLIDYCLENNGRLPQQLADATRESSRKSMKIYRMLHEMNRRKKQKFKEYAVYIIFFPGCVVLFTLLYFKIYQPFLALFEYFNRNNTKDKTGSKANNAASYALLIYTGIITFITYGVLLWFV